MVRRDTVRFDGELAGWQDVKDQEQWSALLVGNGVSLAVWDRFGYASIFEQARYETDYRLKAKDLALFESLGTENFEQVLSSLMTAEQVANALEIDVAPFSARYKSIKRALVQAVRSVHVPWLLLGIDTLDAIRKGLKPYNRIFTTNYDLLVYWAIMAETESSRVKDFFWNSYSGEAKVFDVTNAETFGNHDRTIYHLHGGLHLYRTPEGRTLKRISRGSESLLDLFGEPLDDASPLIVTEGNSSEKLAAIGRNDYLSFCYQTFSKHEGSLVVLGHSLGGSDEHLTSAIHSWGRRSVAIGLRKADETTIRARKAELHSKLPDARLTFFNSATHPLTRRSLHIESE